MGDLAQATLSARTAAALRGVLAGERRGWRAGWLLAGPAVVSSVAYMDPGNYATNIQAGARYGYALLWVVVAANMIGMLFQAMSARLGIVTGRNLAELCRAHFPRPVVAGMWAVSEVAAMATDLAEFLGGAIGLSLLLHIPLLAGMAVTAAVVYAILLTEQDGFRPVELVVGGLIAVIGLSYLIEFAVAPPDWRAVAVHSVVPGLPDGAAVTLAVGIVGATVMPHAIYLQSGLAQARVAVRSEAERRRLLRFSDRETVVALVVAGAVNMAMVAMAASAFHAGHREVASIGTAYRTLIPLLGAGAAGVFLMSVLASGVSSSVVGTMAGQIIMQGFVGVRIPIWVRRLVTMVPAFIVVALGYDTTESLVLSQVVLSLALPIPMVALLLLSRRTAVMGAYVARGWMFSAAVVGAVVVLALNAVLLLQALGVAVPGLPAG